MSDADIWKAIIKADKEQQKEYGYSDFDDYMQDTDVKKLNQQGWDLVNNAETIKEVNEAETWIRTNIKDNDVFDELMMALSYKHREMNKNNRGYR